VATPSPRSHLYRLLLILVVFGVGFLAVKQWATPDSWDYEHWYRGDAVVDAATQPLVYGGNDSCKTCHKDVAKLWRKKPHRKVACETCHGPIIDHAKAEKKIAVAFIDKTRAQCLNCHLEGINRPKAFPQFSKQGEIGKLVPKHKELDAVTPCSKCHEAHDPRP
jgi:hypothetical protein